jgi:hypothetical protein
MNLEGKKREAGAHEGMGSHFQACSSRPRRPIPIIFRIDGAVGCEVEGEGRGLARLLTNRNFKVKLNPFKLIRVKIVRLFRAKVPYPTSEKSDIAQPPLLNSIYLLHNVSAHPGGRRNRNRRPSTIYHSKHSPCQATSPNRD